MRNAWCWGGGAGVVVLGARCWGCAGAVLGGCAGWLC